MCFGFGEGFGDWHSMEEVVFDDYYFEAVVESCRRLRHTKDFQRLNRRLRDFEKE